MTHFAPVGPLRVVADLPAEVFGDYHLLIAPKVLEAPSLYGEIFGPSGNWSPLVILDNGVIELGYPLDIRDLYKAARTVNATVVVLPDTIDDARMTVKQAQQNVPAYRRLDDTTALMGVVQGTTLEECLECAEGLSLAGVNWFGVPRGLTPNLGSRVQLVSMLGEMYPDKTMHVLGFSENIKDDVESALAHPNVRGMDAATPLWYGLEPWFSILPMEPPTNAGFGRRPKDYWSKTGSSFEAEYNVRMVRMWLGASSVVAEETSLPLSSDAQIAPTAKDEPAAPSGQ